MFQRVIICIGIASRTKGCPFAGTYRLSWTSRVPKRGKLGLEILGDVKPVGEESADEKLEIIPVADVLVRDIVLENAVNSWSARCLHFASKLQSMKPKSNALSLVPPAREFPVVVVVVVVIRRLQSGNPTWRRPLHQAAPSASVVRGIKIFEKSASPDI